MSKDADRARAEKTMEEMMGDDWRVFRARLVAQEQAEAEEAARSRVRSSGGDVIHDEKQAKQAQLGELFAGAISHIFKGKHDDHHHQNSRKEGVRSIFDGDTVGRADLVGCEDPFVSEGEIPLLMKPKVTNFDKHRWAHPIPHIESGSLLIANEKLGGVFHQTVVLIVDHHETLGTTGIVINRPLNGNLLKVVSETESQVDLSLKLAFNSAPVSYGGPVMQEEYRVLHGYAEVEGAKKVAPGVFVGGSDDLVHEVRQNKLSPDKTLFVKGHAAWVAGQLEREISKGVWYTAAASSDLVLRYAGAPVEPGDNTDDLWSDILSAMGGDYATIAAHHGSRGDMRMMP